VNQISEEEFSSYLDSVRGIFASLPQFGWEIDSGKFSVLIRNGADQEFNDTEAFASFVQEWIAAFTEQTGLEFAPGTTLIWDQVPNELRASWWPM
jgi:hypothetical protein